MPKLIIYHPDGSSAKYGLNGPSFTIGRAEDNDIVLPNGAASSHHAVLKLNETGDYTISDLDSTNKTKVNGRAIQTSPLRQGDSLLFGDIAADYQSEIAASPSFAEDAPTQVYERKSAPPEVPAAGARPAHVVVAPQVIRRPASTMGRRSTNSADGGCFALVVFAFVLPAAFFAGLVIRHHHDKGEWFWNYLAQHLHS